MRARSARGLVLLAAALALASACGGGDEAASNEPSGPGAGGSGVGQGGGSGGSQAGAPQPGPLKVDSVPWNPGNVATGKVAAVVEHEGHTVLFGDAGAVVIAGGAVAALDPSIKAWRSAASLPSADGQGRWAVGLDAQGKLHRLVDLGQLELISARYGLADEAVAAFAPVGDSGAVFALPTGLAVADGQQVLRHDVGALDRLATYKNLVAGAGPAGVVLFDLTTRQGQRFALANARAVAFDDTGRLLAAAGDALHGQLAPRIDADLHPITTLPGPVTDLAGAGLRVWFSAGGELGLYVAGALSRTAGLGLPADASLTTSAGGDLWVVAGGEARRFALGSGSPDEKAWQEKILPVFARACSKCHLPGGSGGRDLSAYAAWAERRGDIRERVVSKRSMPPAGSPLDEADRAAVDAWCSAKP